jgi:effector-binding domain-containing protein
MKLIKYLFFLILIVLIGGAVYFGTKDGKFDVANTKTINAPVSMLYDNVNDFKNWQEWGPWMADDPTLQITYADTTQGVGGSYTWTSELMGDGSMRTVSNVENESIDQKIVFVSPFGESKSDVYWKFNPTEAGTEVTWGMKGEQSFIEKVFMAFQSEDFESSVKKMYGQGLDNLEQTIQEEMGKYSITVEGIKDHGGGFYMYTTAVSTQSELGNKMAPMMGKVSGFMERNKIAMAGMPFTIYNEWDTTNGSVIFSTAIPTRDRIIVTEGDVLCGYMEPTAAVKTVLMGNYTNLAEAYTKAQAYVAENNLIIDPAKQMFEVYNTDPEQVPNPAEWRTEIYIPVFKDLRSNHPLITQE